LNPAFKKRADAEGALPQIQVPTAPASDKNTLMGVVPPVAYSRVNAGNPLVSDAGSYAQKSIPPMGAQSLPKTAQVREDSTMNTTPRLRVQDLVKQAMSNAAQRAQIAEEGARQMKMASEKCEGCDKEGCECKEEKKASPNAQIPTDYALKLAAAIEFAAPIVVNMAKRASESLTDNPVSLPPGVSASSQSGSPPGPGQQGHGHHQPPMRPGTQKGLPQEQGGTQLENTLHHHVPGTQSTAMSGGQGKTAFVAEAIPGAIGAYYGSQREDVPGGGLRGGLGAYGGALVGGALGGAGGLMLGGKNPVNQLAASSLGGLAGMAGGARLGYHLAMPARKGPKGGENTAPVVAEVPVAVGGGEGKTASLLERNFKVASGAYSAAPLSMAKQEKKAHLVDDFLAHVKEAEDAINPAQISAGPAVMPDMNASEEPGGAPVGGMPQGPRGLIASNEAAINYKKQVAYNPRKSELAAYFNEPALSASTDKTLNEAFAHTGEAGTKISSANLVKSAAARALLAKLAAESDKKDEKAKEDEKKKKDKQSNAYC
jgi:hypothetical protein